MERRNADLNRVEKMINMSARRENPGTEHISEMYDAAFWMGDFNYRINGTRESIAALMNSGSENDHAVLVENDQLNIEKDQYKILHGFDEGIIEFPPTYKLDVNSDIFDTSRKLRIPAWTDRIFYKNGAGTGEVQLLSQVSYNSINDMRISDHRPVFSQFILKFRTDSAENASLTRSALGSGLAKRVKKKSKFGISKKSSICSIM